MKYFRTLLLLFTAPIAIVGCSNVGFQSIPKQSCSSGNYSSGTSCTVQGQNLNYSFTFQTGDVDILFVDDNSGSMYKIQTGIASAFSNFLASISNLNYQIAVVTTDISTSINPVTGQVDPLNAANGNGAFQDGKFLEFTDTSGNPSGDYVLTPSTPNANDLFAGTIQRQETLNCENSDFSPNDCPSDVPRGIYAVNDAISRDQNNFFRPGAPLAVVVVSDSDECENGVSPENCGSDYLNDEPATLVQNMASKFPTQSFSVNSIVVPNVQCVQANTVTNPNGIETWGIIGTTYMDLSQANSSLTSLGNIVPGDVGDICLDSSPYYQSYSQQLSNIGSLVAQHTQNNPIQLACTPDPKTISISTSPAQYMSQISYSIDSQNRVTFSNIPLGVQVTFSYECPRY